MLKNKYTPRRGHRNTDHATKDRINLCMSAQTKRLFDKAAWDAGMSISKWLEMVGLKFISKKTPPATR